MRKMYLLFALFFMFAQTQAQLLAYFPLEQDAYKLVEIKAKNGNDSIINAYIHTQFKPQKMGKWNYYPFETDISLENLDNKNAKTTLFINKKRYTGFVKTVRSRFLSEVVLMYQFKKGKLERVEILENPNANKPQLLKKPVLYLYPTEKQLVNVKINLNNQTIIHPYPAYNKEKGWNVIASPDGNLINQATGKTHYCLFWESEGKPLMSNIKEGFVVKGEETAIFLEEKLAKLGLNAREANEFIVFWLPQLEQNPYNAIYFANEEYNKATQLNITPTPETQIRVMMVWQSLNENMKLKEQVLPQTPNRRGFTVVEWGGTQITSQFSAGK